MTLKASLSLIYIAAVGAFSPSQINRRYKGETHSLSPSTTTLQRSINGVRTSTSQTQRYDRITLLILAAAKVGVFFGTSTGNTETIADMIAAEFGDDAEGPFEIDGLQGSIAQTFGKYDALIVGTPTWNTGADSERSGTGWDEIYYGEMQDLKLQGKNVAVFGLGDQISYAENYADASGELHDVFQNLGCNMLGYTSQDGYEHEDSKAIRGDKFCGLLCDQVNQEELSAERVENWVAQLRGEGILESVIGVNGATSTSDQVVESAVPTASAEDTISALERENAELRMMLEQNSKLMDEVMQGNNDAYTPHYNPRTCITMWTSADGRSCYYTTDAPKSP